MDYSITAAYELDYIYNFWSCLNEDIFIFKISIIIYIIIYLVINEFRFEICDINYKK